MLTYREVDYKRDLPNIIGLIKKNLDLEYNLEFFCWKHLENPFGKSYGLLALDGEKIIGVKMFMFWEFNTQKGRIKAIRPVDTAIDENYRGQGIFKKLTLDGLYNIFVEYDLIFNTPNKNSLPGNLKMGWRKMKNLNYYRLGLINPFAESTNSSSISIDLLQIKEEGMITQSSTLLSNEFLKWRYKDPIYQIECFSSEGSYVIYRKSKINLIPFLIIFEIIGDPSKYGILLNSLAKKNKIALIYYYGDDLKNGQFLKTFKRNRPVVVIRNDKGSVGNKLQFSLGDLESEL